VTQTLNPDDKGWDWFSKVLLGVSILFLIGAVVLLVKGPKVLPDAKKAEKMSAEYAAVDKAARETTLAFLDVDYTDMEPRIKRVLKGATGSFEDQYSRASVELKAQLAGEQTVASGKVLEVGIGDINTTAAVVFVAADQTVRNKSTKGKDEPRYYRFQLDMTKVKGVWKVSEFGYLDGRELDSDSKSGVGSGDSNKSPSATASPESGDGSGQ
jgi:Mce-associated membrane protein